VLAPGAAAALVRALDERPRAGIVGPTILNPDGSVYRSVFPFPSPGSRLFLYEPFASLAELLPAGRERYVGRWRPHRSQRVPWVLGAALAVRRTAFEDVGGFDERFEMYCEEVDLSRRLLARGWETHYVPVTRIVHIGGASTTQRRSAMRARLELSLIRLYRRHHRGVTLRLALGGLWAKAAGYFLRDTCRYALSRARRRAELAEDLAGWRTVLAAVRSTTDP
jgi:N-acetylglucosaminyl-diphospho-decaprenol L-rhamnosyltransferase